MTEGRGAYDAVMQAPSRANEYVPKLTMQSGAFLFALFRYEIYVTQSLKFRLMELFLEPRADVTRCRLEAQQKAFARFEEILRRILGPLEMADFLKTQFTRPEDSLDAAEDWTRFVFAADGSLVPAPAAHGGALETVSKPSLEAI